MRFRVVGFDPGEHIGWCVISGEYVENESTKRTIYVERISNGILEADKELKYIVGLYDIIYATDVENCLSLCVVEDYFVMNSFRNNKIPLQVIGNIQAIITLICKKNLLVMQTPSYRHFVDPRYGKELKKYIKAKSHNYSAICHGIAYIARNFGTDIVFQ